MTPYQTHSTARALYEIVRLQQALNTSGLNPIGSAQFSLDADVLEVVFTSKFQPFEHIEQVKAKIIQIVERNNMKVVSQQFKQLDDWQLPGENMPAPHYRLTLFLEFTEQPT